MKQHYMASPSTQFATARRMGIFDPLHHISTWEDILGADSGVNITSTCTILQADARLLNKVQFHHIFLNKDDSRLSYSY